MAENGNIAAMREALVQCELFLGNVSRHAHPTLNPGDKCTACVGVDELRGMVVRALTKPARNCDRYEMWNDAWDAFDATYSGPTDPGEMDYRFSVWLFAKATKKGDGDDGK